jgi:hypothetical protein
VCTSVGVLSLLSQVMIGQPFSGFVVFFLFYLGGVGVREHNPFAAAIMLAYCVIEFLASIVLVFANSPGIRVVKIIIIALLLSNLRATWIAAGWKPHSEEAALPPRFSETFLDKFADTWPAWIWPKVKVFYYIFPFASLALMVAGLIVLRIRRGL